MNLQTIKKQAGLTNKDIGRQLDCSPSKAGGILQGWYLHIYLDEDIQQLADILGVTFERCWFAMCESYNELMHTPGAEHQRASEVRQGVQEEMQEQMPDLGVEVDVARELASVEGVLVVPEERRLEPRKLAGRVVDA